MGKGGKNKPSGKSKNDGGRAPTLDLHGRRVEEVFDAVEIFLRRNEASPRVRIMSGKGTGKVRDEVVRYLKLANFHYSFERLGNGSPNEGVLIVFME